MAAYIIAFIDVTDPKRYEQYKQRTPAAIAKHGGRFIARGGRTKTLEGPDEKRRVVILEFPDFQRAEAFFNSEEYQEAKSFREGAAKASFILVEGWNPPDGA
jgi:uncharacterized protein (DUF1330 family)